MQFAQAHTRKVARPVAAGRPPVSSKSVLRRSAELLKKQSGDTRQLLEQFRNKEPSEGAGCDGLAGRGHRRPYEDRPLRQPQAHSPARSQAEEMHAIQEHIQEVEDEEAANDLSDSDVVTKYRAAGTIANEVLAKVMAACVPGVKAVELCQLGDDAIEELVGKIYNGKEIGRASCRERV